MSRARDLADYVSTGVTSDELDKLDGLTATTDELNLVDGSVSGPLSHRNLIINGAMQVAQRGTSNISVSSTRVYTLDRFSAEKDTNTMTASQSTDAPTGFKYSLKLENGTGASASGSDVNNIRYFAEGYDTNHLEIGTSNAKTVTLSFWVKSSIAGTYCVAFFDQGNDNPYVTTYTIDSANVNTWEQKVITLTLSTYGSWVGSTTNEANLGIVWDLGSGSDRQVSTLNTWHDGVANDWSHSSQTAWVATTGATFYLTGVQLELGVATPFEHRSYGEELARCYRYYQRYSNTTGGNVITRGNETVYSTTAVQNHFDFIAPMRTSPAASKSGVDVFRSFSGNSEG